MTAFKANKKAIKYVLLFCGLLLVTSVLKADELSNRAEKIMAIPVDQDYAAYLAEGCTSCHQTQQGTGTPVIAGMSKQHIIISLLLYQNGSRDNAAMKSIAIGLGDEEVASLAEYFSQMVESQ